MGRLFLCGDIMIGRGMDQAFPHSADPSLYEPWIKDARHYLAFAEKKNGPVPAPLTPEYPWGNALNLIREMAPEARIGNLETALTNRGTPWPNKGIHYRAHPANAACLRSAGLDACSLANNHILDWGYGGLTDTLQALKNIRLPGIGAGPDEFSALQPASITRANGRHIKVFAYAVTNSGVPETWAATEHQPGVALLPDLSPHTAQTVASRIREASQPDDWVILSIHWGGNWGYEAPAKHSRFARQLIDEGGVDVVHGHSSHHPMGIELYGNRLILYGCGDCLNDYEGITGHAAYRPDLVALWFPELSESGALHGLTLVPMRLCRMRLEEVNQEDATWLAERLNLASPGSGVHFAMDERGWLGLGSL